MNDIIITDFGPQHFEQALDVLYESNCMHARCDSKQFICAPKENSVPYVRSVLEDENKFGFVALDNNIVAGILFGASSNATKTFIATGDSVKFSTLPSAANIPNEASENN